MWSSASILNVPSVENPTDTFAVPRILSVFELNTILSEFMIIWFPS